jgi:cytochrome b561
LLTSIVVLGFTTVAGINAANETFQDAAHEVHGLLQQHGLVFA